MKNQFIARTCLVAGLSVCSLAFTPRLHADTSNTTTPASAAAQDSKNGESVADQHSATTGTASTPGTLDRTNSKDNTASLDKNPSTRDTNSDEKSATKDPTGAPGSPIASGNSPKQENMASDKEKPMTDSQFMEKAAQGGMTEVELGKLAQTNASSADVKEFGSHMVMDHSTANTELKTLAQSKGVTVPAQLDAKHQATVDHFKHLSGPAFDQAYVKNQVKDHEKTVSAFQQEANGGKDADVKAFATKTLPTLQSHLTEIQTLQTKVK